jgi:hypothetical protein
MLENLWANLSDNAKDALTKAGIKFEELKGISAAKFAELSAKAEAAAAEAKEEGNETLEELKALRAKIASHEGGALGYLTEKAKELYGEAKEEAGELAEDGKDFWEKAKDYVSDKVADAKEALNKKDDESKPV